MALDLLFPNFDALIRTPEDVQRLNEAILQLAVQGKLVTQDPTDEPASELLKRIEAEKTQLINERKIARGKPMPPINSGQAPSDLPDHWLWVRLGTIALSVQYGYTASADYSVMDVKFLRITDIQDDRVEWNQVPGCSIDRDEEQKYVLRQNDILIARTGGTVGKSYLIEDLPVKAVFASYLIRIVPPKDADAKYLKLYLGSKLYWSQLVEQSKGTGQPNVNGVSLSQLILPLPPLAEQQRIVAKVDELFAQTRALEARLRQAQADIVTANRAALHRLHTAQDEEQFQTAWRTIRDHFDVLYDDPRNVAELRQRILDLAVRGKLVAQDPNDEPASELLRRIEAKRQRLVKEGLISVEDTGQLPLDSTLHVPIAVLGEVRSGIQKSNIRNPKDNPRRYITVAHVQRYRIDPGDPRYFEVSNEELEKWRLVSGDVLVIEGNGSAEHIGRAALFLGEIEDCVHQNHVIRIRPNRDFILPEYLNLYLNSPSGREKILERSRTTSGLYNLSVGRIRTIEVPLPAFTRQHRIVAKVDQLMRLCDALEAGLAQTETVRRKQVAAMLA